jgi:hypothetical protein
MFKKNAATPSVDNFIFLPFYPGNKNTHASI